MKQCGLNKYLDYAVYYEDVESPKPHPESLFTTLEHFQIRKGAAVMIGDSITDIEAGKNAGVKTIGVLTGFDKEILNRSNPDILATNIAEVSKLFHA